jgi:hypothetical protein
MRTAFFLLALSFCLTQVAASSEEEPKVLFYLSCDNTLEAKTGNDILNPLEKSAGTASYVKGKKGEALKLYGALQPYRYSAEKSLNIKSGTVAFWLRIPEEAPTAKSDLVFQTGKKEDFNRIEMRFSAPAQGNKAKFYTNFYVKRMRPEAFSMCSWGQAQENKWKLGEWIHVIVVWDDLQGVALFYNGQQVVGPPGNNGVFAIMPKADTMDFGPAWAIIDELYIFDRPVPPSRFAEISGTKFDVPLVSVITYMYVNR